MLNLHDDNVRNTIEELSNIIRAEHIENVSFLDLYAGRETIKNISNIQNQVIYGRRGTGKTHLLKAFQELLVTDFQSEKKLPIYIDLRKLLPLIPSGNNDPVLLGILIFKYIIQEVCDVLVENVKFIFDFNHFEFRTDNTESEKLQWLAEKLKKLNYSFDGKEFKKLDEFKLNQEEISKLVGSLKLNKSPEFNASGEKQIKDTTETKKGLYLSFADISNILSDIPEGLDLRRIIVLLDEWSEIPIESQPFLAELVKRAFITSKFSFKIAAIPFRTKLGYSTESKFFGLEEGGDIFGFNLDNRLVYEVNKQQTRDFFNELLFKHITSINQDIHKIYLDPNTRKASTGFINEFFATQALREILLASAGVPRDFINLFINSYDKFLLNTSSANKRIGVRHIRLATIDWYKTDKKERVDNNYHARQLLEKIVNEIVLKKQKTHFLIPDKHANNVYLQQLIDLRVIHLRKVGYSHQDNKGVSYNVYSIDYGCYTSINIPQSSLDSALLSDLDTIDNFRDIRRVSLEDAFFNDFLLQVGDAFNCKHCKKPIDVNHLAYKKQKLCNNCFESVEEPVAAN
ncbi:ORC-CDC6 family AAA ATPase [Paenibacillus tyrfis]|uniref:ORC-CDC6 family AAA ATPase n=1 Tax=Paenibacillus tyrfis TaxID=1501230 RepID=UPI00209CAE53|nr:hypothetical protein [Paenibacillus tyrfis]MCP1311301.1 hypothetical protein [Paenibacillus tyrfis]